MENSQKTDRNLIKLPSGPHVDSLNTMEIYKQLISMMGEPACPTIYFR